MSDTQMLIVAGYPGVERAGGTDAEDRLVG